MPRKLLTLVFVQSGDQVLLGMKKRGFGAGRWNGFGGKLQPGETLEEAAQRELREECGLEALSLTAAGVHEFEFEKQRGEILEVHVFRCTQWQGEPCETEEMRPKWFSMAEVPYADMWPDDILWLPQFLDGKTLYTRFLFGEGDQVLEHSIRVVEE